MESTTLSVLDPGTVELAKLRVGVGKVQTLVRFEVEGNTDVRDGRGQIDALSGGGQTPLILVVCPQNDLLHPVVKHVFNVIETTLANVTITHDRAFLW